MKVFIKILKIIGVIISAVLIFTNCLWMYDVVSDIENLNYPATAIMHAILYTLVIIGSILLTISIIKNNKKLVTVGVVIVMIGAVMYPITKAVNSTIIQATDVGAMLEYVLLLRMYA